MDIYPGAAPNSIVFFDYQGTLMRRNELVRDMDRVIQEIAKLHRLVIVSFSPKKEISALLEKNNLLSLFTDIKSCTGQDDKGNIMKEIALEYSVPLQNCIFVTDTYDDVLEARRAKIQVIFVPWGIEPNLPDDREIIAVRTPAELTPMLTHFLS